MAKSSQSPFQPSPWPLPAGGSRVLIPAEQVRQMASDERTCALHPHGFGFYPHASGHQMMRQRHEDSLVIYCVEGAGTCHVDGNRHPVAAGHWLVLPAGQGHRYQADAQQPWSIFWMHLGGDALRHWLARFTGNGPVTRVGLHEALVHDFRALLDSTASGYGEDNLLLAASLCQHLLATANLLAGRSQEEDRLTRLHAFMDTHLDARLTLGDLQDAFGGRSRYQFIREYKRRTGQTPVQAYLHRKMAHACYLLETGDRTVAHIASQLGFDDPYYFSRAFTRVVGVSPARYRRQGGD